MICYCVECVLTGNSGWSPTAVCDPAPSAGVHTPGIGAGGRGACRETACTRCPGAVKYRRLLVAEFLGDYRAEENPVTQPRFWPRIAALVPPLAGPPPG
jgi:hypothetical protein